MGYERPYGKREGLRERMKEWKNRLSNDPQLPWAGLGLIDDLTVVIDVLPDNLPSAPKMEYDL